MQKCSEYTQRERECRELAQKWPPGRDRDWVLALADYWGKMARDRKRRIKVAA